MFPKLYFPELIDTVTVDDTLIAAIWGYASRTLTQTAAQVAASVSGSDLAIVRGVTLEATLTGLTIPATWSKIYFTIKKYPGTADSGATVQIVESNPGDADDGLIILNAATNADESLATLTIDQGAGTAAILITDNATALLALDTFAYDLKALLSDGSSVVLTQAHVSVGATSTESIT